MNLVASEPNPSARSVEPSSGLTDPRLLAWCGLGLLVVALLWSYWTTLATLAWRWRYDPHSPGFLVPVFAFVVLWRRRQQLSTLVWSPSWWGLAPLTFGLGLRLAVAKVHLPEPVDAFSLLPTIAGLVLLVGGWAALRWSWPAIAFLAFMTPLPHTVQIALADPLRGLATDACTYLLQTLGYPAFSRGNSILIEDVTIDVARECAGLSMLVTFVCLATAFVLVLQLPLLDRWLLLASAIPIAVLANIIRITVTSMAFHATGSPAVQDTVHDVAGWLMMPLALGLFCLVSRFLRRVLIAKEEVASHPLPMNLGPLNLQKAP